MNCVTCGADEREVRHLRAALMGSISGPQYEAGCAYARKLAFIEAAVMAEETARLYLLFPESNDAVTNLRMKNKSEAMRFFAEDLRQRAEAS